MLKIKEKNTKMLESIDKEMDNLRKDFSKRLGLDKKMRFKNGKS